MTASEIVRQCANEHGMTKVEVQRVLDALVFEIQVGVIERGRIQVGGLGTFEAIPNRQDSRLALRFTPSKRWRELVSSVEPGGFLLGAPEPI